MSNRLFQDVIQQMRDTIDRTIGVIDASGSIIACSSQEKIGESVFLNNDISFQNEIFENNHYTYQVIKSGDVPEFCVFVEGTDNDARTLASLITISLTNIKQYYDEKFDRTNFMKNIVLDNILPGDIYVRARELRFNSGVQRVVFLVHLTIPSEVPVYDILLNIFPDRDKDFLFNISQEDIVIVKEIKNNTTKEDLYKLAETITATLSGDYYVPSIVSFGTVVDNIKDVARSFKEAQVALEVSHIFDTEKKVVNFENLGIARLIYQLPTTLCEMFLKEVFEKGSIDSLDEETLFTIQKFFENNLNVSETSRKLFVHRNTLVYRLEKIKKLTGLDLRLFDHAIVFKVALMVKKYLDSQNQSNY